MMKKALLSLLLAMICMPATFAQTAPTLSMKVDTVSSCQKYTWPRDNHEYTKDTVVTHTVGDTVFVLHFTKYSEHMDTTTIIPVTGGCYASWNGKTWESAGFFKDTLTTVQGCDSIVKIKVTLGTHDTVVDTTVCGSYTAPWGTVYTTSQNFDTTVTDGECTYHNVINLTVHPEYKDTINVETIAGCYYRWDDTIITDTMVHVRTFQTANGCDSIVRVHITAYTGVQYDAIDTVRCDRFNPSWSTTPITTSGDYVRPTYTGGITPYSTAACQHNDTYHVTIVPSINLEAEADTVLINAGCSYTWEGNTYTDTNVHFHTFVSVIGGCDSMVGIKISYSGHQYDTTRVDYCGSTYNWKNSNPTLPLPGTAADYNFTRSTDTTVSVYDSVSGCTNHYTLLLNMYDKRDTVDQYYCGEYYSFTFQRLDSTQVWKNTTARFTTSGMHAVSPDGDSLILITAGTNCKTYRTINLDLNVPEKRYRADSIDTAVCVRFKFRIDRKYGADIYVSSSCTDSNFVHEEHKQNNRNRCYDSIVNVTLVVHPNTILNRTQTACDEFTWTEFDGKTYTETGTYRDTLSERDANGCLQIGTLNLTINKTPVIDIEGNWTLHPGESTTLKAVPTAGSDPIRNNGYKWSWGDTIVRDSVVTINNVTSNLDILLEATSIKNCTDTNWITITANVGIDEVEGLQVNIYPNPASRYINIESAEPMTDVVIYNTVGQQVISRTVEGNHTQLDLGSLASGHYTLRINGADGNQTTRKFIVRK